VEIFKQTRMTRSLLYDESRPVIRNRARGHTGMCGACRDTDYTPLNLIYGDDGIYTTIEDMYRWDQALEMVQLVEPETWREALTPARLNSGRRSDYGFGWLLERFDRFDAHWHNGEWAGFRTYHLRIPARRFAVLVLANCDLIDATDVGSQIARIYVDGS
jgi:CubicO group peptidase (beta-lactamase class C family)